MRHHNPKSSSYFSCHYCMPVYTPYLADNWNFSKASTSRRYIQVLQYLNDHPYITRSKLHEGVFKKKHTPGNHSSLYAVLLWQDLIDYDKKFLYFITPKGLKLLKEAYINDIAKLTKSTASNVRKAIES